jgi:hypothetical protein
MPLKIEIFLPNESVDFVDESEDLQNFFIKVGDYLAQNYGNEDPEGEFNLADLVSFIIIKDEELPNPENFEDTDMYFIIPIEGDE